MKTTNLINAAYESATKICSGFCTKSGSHTAVTAASVSAAVSVSDGKSMYFPATFSMAGV